MPVRNKLGADISGQVHTTMNSMPDELRDALQNLLKVTWMLAKSNNNNSNDNDHKKAGKGKWLYECVYSGSGKVPLICASVAFVALAIAMLVQHSFMLIAITKTSPPVYVSWDPESSRPMKSLTWQAAFFFIST